MTSAAPDDCRAGQEALARAAWPEARAAFTERSPARESPEALEGLGLAAWWLDLADVVFDARERAYRLYRDRGDEAGRRAGRGLARVGLLGVSRRERGRQRLAAARAAPARGHGPPSAERAWLEVREGSLCLYEDCDPDRAHALASEGVRDGARGGQHRHARCSGARVQGLALVTSGAVAEGMRAPRRGQRRRRRRRDDTISSRSALSCCYLVAACEHVRDYDRAVQWCTRLQGVLREMGTAAAVRRLPHAVRLDLHVARHLARGRAGADRGGRASSRRAGRR